jgi:hypothetical protein
MLKNFLKLLSGKSSSGEQPVGGLSATRPLAELTAPGVPPFDFAASLQFVHGLPVPDWPAVSAWVASLAEPEDQADAWAAAELAWLAHLQQALGPRYHLISHESAMLLSPLAPKVASATVEFMTKTLTRIERMLEGVGEAPEWGKDIMLVFEDGDSYYRYVSRYYPDDGEFAFSGGMHVNFGCGHFVTFQAELRDMEPVIVHEMTHGCLSHLDIPAWLNEGLAVNTERRLSPPAGQQHTPQELHRMHQAFWTEETIQEFWSGKSFLRPDEGNLLSYELARILAEQFSRDWDRFKGFILRASPADAGRAAAMEEMGVDLGEAVSALFGFEDSASWSPDPALWEGRPERGAF